MRIEHLPDTRTRMVGKQELSPELVQCSGGEASDLALGPADSHAATQAERCARRLTVPRRFPSPRWIWIPQELEQDFTFSHHLQT